MTDHDHMRALLAAATPGPWVACDDDLPGLFAVVHVDPEGREVIVACGFYQADADLIVAARTELPGLLDEIERLRAGIGGSR
jgi:hypothetical protein